MKKSELNFDSDIIHTDLVKEAKMRLPRVDKISEISKFFKIFSDNTRVEILWVLDNNDLCVCDIAAVLNMTKSAISHQLSYLKQNDLVRCKRQGKEIIYSLADDHVKQIFEKAIEHLEEEKNEKSL